MWDRSKEVFMPEKQLDLPNRLDGHRATANTALQQSVAPVYNDVKQVLLNNAANTE